MNLSKKTLIIFLTRNGFSLFSPFSPFRNEFIFPAGSVKDLSVVDKDKVKNEIKTFLSHVNSIEFKIIIFLSEEILFQKEIVGKTDEERNFERENFLQFIPFDKREIYQKRIIIDSKEYDIVINKEFLDTVVDSLKKLGFSISMVIPVFFVKGADEYLSKVNGENIFDSSILNTLDSNKLILKDINFIQEDLNTKNAKRNKMNLIIFFIFFIVILIISLIIYTLYLK